MRLCAVVSLASFVDCWSWTYFWPGGPNAASLCLARSRFDGRLSLRLLNRGRLCATLRDSSRNSLCGQLIGRSVALSGARCTHCWGVPNTPNWHFLWFFLGGAEIKDTLKMFHGMNPTTWYMVRQSPASFSGVTTRCQSYLRSCCFVQSRNVTTSIYGHA